MGDKWETKKKWAESERQMTRGERKHGGKQKT
jgi:hypothetical protein